MIRIPFHSNVESGRSLQHAIEEAARRSGIFPERMARHMTFLLEEIANEVAMGNAVRIPGFGIFAPVIKRHRTQGQIVTRVYFYPARAFTNIVALQVPNTMKGQRAYENFQRRHHPSASDKSNHSIRTAMAAWRQSIRKNANGMDQDDD